MNVAGALLTSANATFANTVRAERMIGGDIVGLTNVKPTSIAPVWVARFSLMDTAPVPPPGLPAPMEMAFAQLPVPVLSCDPNQTVFSPQSG